MPRLPPGRARLATKTNSDRVAMPAMTIGISAVARLAAVAAGVWKGGYDVDLERDKLFGEAATSIVGDRLPPSGIRTPSICPST